MLQLLVVAVIVGGAWSQPRACIYTDKWLGQVANLGHEIQQSQQCVACLPQCTSCTSSSDTTCSNGNCESRYFYDKLNQQCARCPNLCDECSDASSCASCIDGFYLEPAGTCKQCPQGVLQCTSSSILQCADGYYYDAQVYICRRCTDAHCILCSGKAKCELCDTGYLVSSDASGCSGCLVNNCDACLVPGVCSQCRRGYLLQSGQCSKQNCSSISNCIECEYNSGSMLMCTLCSSGFFLLANQCSYGASILCEYSLTTNYLASKQFGYQTPMNRLMDYGSCSSCNGSIAQQASNTENYCLPRLIGASSSFDVQYIIYANTTLCSLPYLVVSPPSRVFNYYFEIPAAFKVTLTTILVISNTTANLTGLANPLSALDLKLNLGHNYLASQLQSYPFACLAPSPSLPSLLLKLVISYKILTDSTNNQPPLQMNLSLSLNSSVGELAYSQLSVKETYLELFLCTTPNCLQCTSASSCTKCVSPYFIQNFNCVFSCDIGYYVNNQTRTCNSQCQTGYFYDISLPGPSSYCVGCPAECSECSSLTSCSGCQSGYFLTSEGRCSRNCSSSQLSQYYPDGSDNLCKRCQNPCKTCSNTPRNCTSCLLGFHFSNSTVGLCVFACPIGFFSKVVIASESQPTPECLACRSPCSSCQMDPSFCTSCQNQFYLFGNICVTTCPSGYLATLPQPSFNDPSLCRPCQAPCSQCQATILNCTSCQFELYLYVESGLGKCLSFCPVGHYSNSSSKKCSPCPVYCLQCSDLNNTVRCVACATGYVLQNYSCVRLCSRGLVSDGACHACPYPCWDCLGTVANYSCSSCVDGYFLQESSGVCLLVCPLGSYGNWSSKKCVTCPTPCVLCWMSISQSMVECVACAANYTLYNGSCRPSSAGCPAGYFDEGSVCSPCSPSCSECVTTETKCTRCAPTRFLLAAWGECLVECPYGYLVINNTLCIMCSKQCSSCSMRQTNCSSCPAGSYIFYNSSLLQWTCLPALECQALSQYFTSIQTGACASCRLPCTSCTSESACTGCDTHTYLLNSNCVSQCPAGYFGANQTCSTCHPSCATCLSLLQCLTCKSNYFYHQQSNACLQQCPPGSFGNLGSMTCETCRFPCLTCDNRQYCLTCSSIAVNFQEIRLILLNGKCLTPCPDGYFSETISGNEQCHMCDSKCQTCSSATSCSSCNHQYFLHGQTCLSSSQCPSQSYPDPNSRSCSSCQPPCLTCTSRYVCSTCILGHSLREGSCYVNCPLGTYASNGSCSQCPVSCSRCLSLLQCQECTNGTYLMNDYANNTSMCMSRCPSGTYLSLAESTCLACSELCRTCQTRSNNCTSCLSDRVLQNQRCIPSCSSFYYERSLITVDSFSTRYCQRCNQSCSKCIRFQICEVCESAYLVRNTQPSAVGTKLIYSSYCSSQCPPATFKNSDKFVCQPCPEGCLECKNSQNCLRCSLENGFVLFNTNCIPMPCPPNMYNVVSDNSCAQRSYCENGLFYIYEREKKCFRQGVEGCPNHLVLRNSLLCADSCPEGSSANFQRICQQGREEGQKFIIDAITRDGWIEILIKLNTTTQPNWIKIFNNVTVRRGARWNSQAASRLLTSQPTVAFMTIQPVQQFSNVLTLELVSETAIQQPTDLTITISMSQPYSERISINELPLQNWYSSTTLQSYKVTSEQIGNYGLNQQRPHPLGIVLVVLALGVSMLNTLRSGKLYLLMPCWDFMQLLYLFAYLNVDWPVQIRKFLSTFSVVWLKWFGLPRKMLIFSPPKVHANAVDMNLLNNLICSIVCIAFAVFIYALLMLIRKLSNRNRCTKSPDQLESSSKKSQLSLLQRALRSNTPAKLVVAIWYVGLPNILYFCFVNLFYKSSQTYSNQLATIVVSALITLLVVAGLGYLFYRQITERDMLDQGINRLKKSIIIGLPIYSILRKLLLVLFLAVFPLDAAFPLCFGVISTVFIIILLCWFDPYNSTLRHKLTLIQEVLLLLFFIFSFLFVCNQTEMMRDQTTAFYLFLATLASISTLAYPLCHLSVLLNIPHICFPQKEPGPLHAFAGYCMEEGKKEYRGNKMKTGANRISNIDLFGQKQEDENQQEGSVCENGGGKCFKQNKKKSSDGKDVGSGQKKKKKMRLPKDRLVENQTDHEADQSSQEGQKKKMKLADYTVRLTKKDAALVNNFKNYDISNNDASNDGEGLAEKEIQLSKLLERQKSLFRNKEKTNEKLPQ